MHNLYKQGMLHRYSPAKRLYIIMDNCSGQNKNKHVRLAAYLLEMEYFRTVEFSFYVRGHTKNAGDQLFNQMKIRFHKEQVHSYSVALKVLSSQPSASMIDATEDMFKDYGNMLDQFNCNSEIGTIRINHIFKVDLKDSNMEMQCSTYDGSSTVRQLMLKRGAKFGPERLDEMKVFEGPVITCNQAGRALQQMASIRGSTILGRYVPKTIG
jgi:hypothetical protein